MNYVKRTLCRAGLVLLFVPALLPSNNTNRWIPILERPESYVFQQRSNITASFMYAAGSTGDQRGGGKVGIPELWGRYNLDDVIKSYRTVYPTANDPRIATGNPALVDQALRFGISGKIEAAGLLLNGQWHLGWQHLWLGARLPVLSLRSTARYDYNRDASANIFSEQQNYYDRDASGKVFLRQSYRYPSSLVDKIRRLTHDAIGFHSNQFTKTGLGDLDVFARWHHVFDHALLTRTIDTAVQVGSLMPTGIERDAAIPSSIPSANNGHWGMYLDWVTGIELKQDLTFGLMFGFTHLFSKAKMQRIATGNEPTIFSALQAPVRIEPGFSFKFSPYVVLGNLTDGLDFQARYSYLRHGDDEWYDQRSEAEKLATPSYLQKDADIVAGKKRLTRWRAHYMSFSLRYDTAVAMEKIKFAPRFFIGYDMPMNGSAFAKVHAVNLGAELQF